MSNAEIRSGLAEHEEADHVRATTTASSTRHAAIISAMLTLSSCGMLEKKPAETSPSAGTPTIETALPEPEAAEPEAEAPGLLTAEQIRTRLRAFADQYRNEIASACDEIKERSETPQARRRAHQYKLDAVTAVYDIAATDDPRQAVLDALVLVTLQSYEADARAQSRFSSEDAALIQERARVLRQSAWALAARVMDEQQRARLLALIERWWNDNQQAAQIWYVRISDFIRYSGTGSPENAVGGAIEGALESVGSFSSGFINTFVPVGDATDSLNEASLAAERAVWLTPRLMILAQWRTEAILLDSLATPEITSVVESTNQAVAVADRATAVAEALPDQIRAEREALVRDLTENDETLRGLLQETRAAIDSVHAVAGETNTAVQSTRALAESTESTINAASELVGSVERLVITARGPEDSAPDDPGEPFDIAEYTRAAEALQLTLAEANTLLENINATTEPDRLAARLEPTIAEAQAAVDNAADRAERLIVLAAAVAAAAGIAIVLVAKLVPTRRRAAG